MDSSLKLLLMSLQTSDGRINKNVAHMLLQMATPLVLPFIKNRASSLVDTIENPQCAAAITKYVNAVVTKKPEIWALRMLDATAKTPQGLLAGGSSLLGEWDECLGVRAPALHFSGQYCLLTACFTPATSDGDGDVAPAPACAPYSFEGSVRLWHALEEQIEGAFDAHALLPAAEGLPLRVGLCVPSACSAEDVRALVERVLAPLLPLAGFQPNQVTLEMAPDDCYVAPGDDTFEGFDTTDFIALFVMFGLFLFVGACTAYDYVTREASRERGSARRRSALLLCFSAVRNAELLAETACGDALPAAHALRVLALVWLVCSSTLQAALRLPLANMQHTLQLLELPTTSLMLGSFLATDTFLLLNGALLAYAFLRRSASGRRFSLLGFYMHHIIRVIPVLGLVLFLQSTVLLKLRDGPLWNLQSGRQCPDTWWYLMLHACNYFRPGTVKCLEPVWLLSVDWQLFALSPLLLLWLRRRPRPVLVAITGLCAVGLGLRFWLAYADAHRAPWGSNYSERTMEALYFPTHMRFVPYLMGIALGYELHRIKYLKTPTLVSQRAVSTLQLAWPLLLAGTLAWVHGAASAPASALGEALHLALVHGVWALGVAVLLYLAVADKAGPLGRLLSLGEWTPLCRLSLGVYLLHVPFVASFTDDTRAALHINLWWEAAAGATALLVSSSLAAALWLLVQAPLERLETLLCAPPKGERKMPLGNGLATLETLKNEKNYFNITTEEKTTKMESI